MADVGYAASGGVVPRCGQYTASMPNPCPRIVPGGRFGNLPSILDQKRSSSFPNELQESVKRTTAPHKYPRSIVFVDALPKTATGKIKRFLLREMGPEEGQLHVP